MYSRSGSIKSQLGILLFFLSFATQSQAQTRYLVPFRDGDLWGYADTNLHLVVKPKYDEAGIFFSGYAQVKKGQQAGLLNARGEEILPPIYNELHYYYGETVVELIPCLYEKIMAVDSTPVHGIFIVRINGRYGLAQSTNLLLPCQYDTILARRGEIEGFELLQNKQHGAYLYDKRRWLYNIVIPARYDIVWGLSTLQRADFDRSAAYHNKFRHDKFLVYVTKGGKKGFVDLNGKEFFRN